VADGTGMGAGNGFDNHRFEFSFLRGYREQMSPVPSVLIMG
jgi:hypothetical protein